MNLYYQYHVTLNSLGLNTATIIKILVPKVLLKEDLGADFKKRYISIWKLLSV